MDDQRHSRRTAAAAAESIGASIERLRRIPGLTYAVIQTKEGERIGDESEEGERLSGQLGTLSELARRLGEVLGTGELQSAAVQGAEQHLLLFATRSHYLGVAADGSSAVAAVEAEVRKSLAASKT